ncbi:MAG TPA: hypothetical protein VHV55_08365 [Pirellulales bacterium]|jgi:hypothetical protein|nr:hypothetical protein [Pirellulales bacterium]
MVGEIPPGQREESLPNVVYTELRKFEALLLSRKHLDRDTRFGEHPAVVDRVSQTRYVLRDPRC